MYFVIINDNIMTNEARINDYAIEAIFKTQAKAEKFIKESLKDCILNDNEACTPGTHENYCGKYYIAKVAKETKPVITITAKAIVKLP